MKTMKPKKINRLCSLLTAVIIAITVILPANAAYEFSTSVAELPSFGTATSYNGVVAPDPFTQNVRNNKDASLYPPPYGVFGGDIPTDQVSLYHNNTAVSGFTSAGQDLPPVGNEYLATAVDGFLPSTSLMDNTSGKTSVSTVTGATSDDYYYNDGVTVGTLKVHTLGKTYSVLEGESNLSGGNDVVVHMSGTPLWSGNVVLAGHNRTSKFGFLKDAKVGDLLTYTTTSGTRTYEVYSKTKVNENTGWDTVMGYSRSNILTLTTCVEDVYEQRWCVKAREVT
jgi:sortase A